MIINNQEISDELIAKSKELHPITNIQVQLEKEFNIKGFGMIYLWNQTSIIDETNAVRELIKEENGTDYSYWSGKKKEGLIPGDIDPDKMIVIGNFCNDVPICLDFRFRKINPPVICLSDNGCWEKICESHADFILIISGFKEGNN